MTGLSFEIFDFRNVLQCHHFVREDIDPRVNQDKRRRAFEGRSDKGGSARAGGHLHAATEHGLHGGRGVGFDDVHIESMLGKQVFLFGDEIEGRSRIGPGLADGHLCALGITVAGRAGK